MFVPPDTDRLAAENKLRRETEFLLHASGTRLVGLLGRIAGEDGLALAWAFMDIALDRDMPPASWPVAEVLEILVNADAHGDRGAAVLRVELSKVKRKIDALESGPWTNEEEAVFTPVAPSRRRNPSGWSVSIPGEDRASKARQIRRRRSGRAA